MCMPLKSCYIIPTKEVSYANNANAICYIINANAISYAIIDVTAISFLIHATVISSASKANVFKILLCNHYKRNE